MPIDIFPSHLSLRKYFHDDSQWVVIYYIVYVASHTLIKFQDVQRRRKKKCATKRQEGGPTAEVHSYMLSVKIMGHICNVQLAAGSLLYSWFVTIHVTLCTYIVEVTNIKRPVANAVSFKERLPSFLPSQHEKR